MSAAMIPLDELQRSVLARALVYSAAENVDTFAEDGDAGEYVVIAYRLGVLAEFREEVAAHQSRRVDALKEQIDDDREFDAEMRRVIGLADAGVLP